MNKGLKLKILALRAKGMSYKMISKELGCRVKTVSHYCRGDNIVPTIVDLNDGNNTKISDDKIAQIENMSKTHTIKSIAELLGISTGTVKRYRKMKNIFTRAYNIKMPDEIIVKIKELCKDHMIKEVAKLLNISVGTVKRYKHYEMRVKLTAEDRKKNNSRCVMDNRKKTKHRAVEYLGGKCRLCGYNKCVEALTFHHRNPEEKSFNICNTNTAWEKLKAELDKCELLCHNCHDEVHAGITQL
jgi:hypothetical protein